MEPQLIVLMTISFSLLVSLGTGLLPWMPPEKQKKVSIGPPDLNPCDFFLWGYLKDRVYVPKPNNIEELKNRITEEIQAIPDDMRERAILSFETRLRRVIGLDGGHFENVLH